ncbi:MAG: hypothetical protein ISR65_06280 [Bacteriovoracaceae bacterium]|nr:hypothetical protein [Bacteriovoracaceae bacterium]
MGNTLEIDESVMEINTLQSLVLTEAKIKEKEIAPEDLYEINVDGVIIGPIHKSDLKALFRKNPAFQTTAIIKNIQEQMWSHAATNPVFQRRKPKIVGKDEQFEHVEAPANDQHFILKEGQKAGPYSAKEITTRLDKGTLLATDLISVDGGVNWIKVYYVKTFDRRLQDKATSLPPLPESINLHQEIQATHLKDIKRKKVQEEAQQVGVLKLAALSNSKIQQSQMNKKILEEPTAHEKNSFSKLKYLIPAILVILCIVMLVAIVNELGRKSKDSTTSLKADNPKVYKLSPVKKKTQKKVNDSKKGKLRTRRSKNRQTKATVRRRNRKRPTPFRKSKSFRRRRKSLANNALADNDYNIDNPAELEPSEEFDVEGPDSENDLFDEEVSF